jgi:hypothetical protein
VGLGVPLTLGWYVGNKVLVCLDGSVVVLSCRLSGGAATFDQDLFINLNKTVDNFKHESQAAN